jgi:hypothetical protein
LVEAIRRPMEDRLHHLFPRFDRGFLFGEIVLIERQKRVIRGSGIEKDELTRRTPDHLKGTLLVERFPL